MNVYGLWNQDVWTHATLIWASMWYLREAIVLTIAKRHVWIEYYINYILQDVEKKSFREREMAQLLWSLLLFDDHDLKVPILSTSRLKWWWRWKVRTVTKHNNPLSNKIFPWSHVTRCLSKSNTISEHGSEFLISTGSILAIVKWSRNILWQKGRTLSKTNRTWII